jgi:hypothetical protein
VYKCVWQLLGSGLIWAALICKECQVPTTYITSRLHTTHTLSLQSHVDTSTPPNTTNPPIHNATMPSQRRARLYTLLLAITIAVLFYMSRGASLTHTSDFTTRTHEALQAQEYAEAARQRDADSVGSRLKAAEAAAKKAADDKSEGFKVAVQGGDEAGKKGVAGRVKLGAGGSSSSSSSSAAAAGGAGAEEAVPGVAAHGGRPRDQAAKEGETDEEHSVEVELNAILKKSPSTSPISPLLPHSLTTPT